MGVSVAPSVLAVREARARPRRRARRVGVSLAAVVLALAATALMVGDYEVPPADVLRILLGRGTGIEEFIVLDLRLPRVVLGALVGVALAVAGALFQSTLGNPLASPDILGITEGASVGAVWAILVVGLGGVAVSLSALVGAVAIAIAIHLLAWRGGVTGYRFVLVGIALGFMASSLLGYLLTRAEVRDAHVALAWMTGSLGEADWGEIVVLALALSVLLPLAAAAAGRGLPALTLGDDAAAGLGVGVQRARLVLILTGVALAAVATAAVGPIAFVAFMSAPIARQLTGGGDALVPAALVGVVIVLASDLIGTHLLPGNMQVPVGVVTGAVGAPYLIWVLASGRRRPAG